MTLFVLGLILAQQVSPEVASAVQRGLAAKNAGDLATAAKEFTFVAEKMPTLAAAHVNLGAVELARERYAAAASSLRRALELNENLPGARAMLGSALLAQGWAADAVRELERAGDRELLGIALYEAGRAGEAAEKLQAAVSARPGDVDLTYYLAQALAKVARDLGESIVAADPNHPRARQLLAEARAASGDRAAAERELRAALQARPNLRGARLALGELLFRAADYERAIPELRAECEQSPGSAHAAYLLGAALLESGDPAALAQLERANRLRPDMPETMLALARASLQAERTDGVEALLRRVIEAEKDSSLAESAHFQLAQLYRRQGRKADADREQQAFQKLRDGRRAASR